VSMRIGISGWTYAPWRGGSFYPKGLRQKDELGYVAQRMNSVEINGSFYSLQRPSSYRTWAGSVPADFVFAVKGSRFISHMKKLNDVETPLANFWASGVLALGTQLGPILWQFPATFALDPARMDAFMSMLPRTAAAAAELATGHDQRVKEGQALTTTEHPTLPIRHAFEMRHASFRSNVFLDLLRQHQMAMVMADNPGRWPIFEDLTTDFMYLRLHGHEQLYASGYSDPELDEWADRMRGWAESGRDVFAYCDNDAKVRAPYDAMGLMSRLGVSPSAS